MCGSGHVMAAPLSGTPGRPGDNLLDAILGPHNHHPLLQKTRILRHKLTKQFVNFQQNI
jgi:hypothetical protein